MVAQEPGVPQIDQAYQLWSGGKPNAAIAILEPLLRTVPHFDDARYLGVAWSVLGSSYLDVERYDEARRAYQHSIEIFQPLPAARGQYASAIDNLGTLEQSLGQHQEAKELCERAQHIYEELGSATGVAITSTNLAVIAYSRGDFKTARRAVAKALAAAKQKTNLRSNDLASLEIAKSAMALHDRRNQEAMSAVEHAIDLWTRAYGPEYFMLVNAYLLRAQVYASSGDNTRGMADARHALALAEVVLGRNTVGYLNAEASYARVLWICGARDEAKRLDLEARRGLTVLERRQCSGCTIDANGFR
jgi:tetratricopeptide (TPR) repeat protein